MITLDPNSSVPLVTQIHAALVSRIRKGILRPGMRLPSVRAMARECAVSTLTVTNAYNRLVAEGHLEARRASGYFVTARPELATRSRSPSLDQLPVDASWLLQHVFETDGRVLLNPGCGWLPESLLDTDGVRHSLGAIAKRPPEAFARYGSPRGYAPLRSQVQTLLIGRNIETRADQIVLTHGAAHGVDLVARTLLRPGDIALVEDPGYCNLLPSLRALGVRVAGVPRGVNGPDLAALQELAERHRPKVFFVNTSLQNPTGTTINPATLYQILRLAETHDFHIVEDDIFADLLPSPAPSLASLDQLGRVTYIGSFTKTISPALRVGFIACGEGLAQRILHMKMASGLTTSEVTEQITHAILTDGHHRSHLSRLRERLARLQTEVCNALVEAGLELYHRPLGGMFVWARMPGRVAMEDLVQRGAEAGIVLAPGRLFSPSYEDSPWLRFNVAYCGDPRLFDFLRGHARAGEDAA